MVTGCGSRMRTNAENDVGGIDCSFKPFAAPQDGAAAPAD